MSVSPIEEEQEEKEKGLIVKVLCLRIGA